MNSQLMLLAGQWVQQKMSQVVLEVHQLDSGSGVHHPWDDLRAEPDLCVNQPVLNGPVVCTRAVRGIRKCFIGFLDSTSPEKFAVEPTGRFVHGKKNQARGLAVNSVKRNQVVIAGFSSQTIEQTFIDIGP